MFIHGPQWCGRVWEDATRYGVDLLPNRPPCRLAAVLAVLLFLQGSPWQPAAECNVVAPNGQLLRPRYRRTFQFIHGARDAASLKR